MPNVLAWLTQSLAYGTIATAFLAIFLLIIIPTVRTGQLRSNPLATAAAAIFFSTAVGHGMLAVQPLLRLFDGNDATTPAGQLNTWWIAVWSCVTAVVAVSYLMLRRSSGRSLVSPALFDDLVERRAATAMVQAQDVALVAASRVQRSETLYRNAFENAMVGMCMITLDGVLTRTNRVFDAMLGRDVGSLVGVAYRDLQHADEFDSSLDSAQQVIAGEIPGYRAQRRFLHLDGSTVYVELWASMVRDPDGGPDWLLAMTPWNGREP